MSLVRLIYASRATKPMSMGDMVAMLDAASEHNRVRGLTGILAFDQETFLQILEGSSQEVNSLYHRIARDPRHQRLTLLGYGELIEREFADWGMANIDVSGQDASARKATLLKYRELGRFDPFSMSGESALRLLSAWRHQLLPASVPAIQECRVTATSA